MKKLFFVSLAAVLMCSACDWFGKKPASNIDQTVVTDDSLAVTPDSVLTETPDSTAEKQTATVNPSGQ
jgi:uncharacterized protein YcfL